ncbi:MAG: efflux RND transporter periplasmic adaptor subunit [Candidatus Riflebacteria bacterium]|nr:efflux RND transporter periplasmic adaptor subunit [Candidatus Riflebacteria bacterium]
MKRIILMVFVACTSLICAVELPWVTASKSERDRFYEAVGTIQPHMTTTLSSKVMGNVLEVLKREGESVKAGEILVKIDAKDIASDLAGARAGLSEASSMMNELDQGLAAAKAQKDQAETSLKMTLSSFERIKGLYEKKSVSKQEFEQADTQLKSAQAQLRSAEAQVAGVVARKSTVSARMGQAQAGISKVQTIKNLAEVVAPFSGRVTSRRIEPGMLAAPGVPLMVIEDEAQQRFEAVVPEGLIGSITQGMPIQVSVDAFPDSVLEGKVAEIFPTGDVLSHTFVVKVAVPQDGRLRTGMYARGMISVGKEMLMLVPKTAIEYRGQLEGLWVECDGKPQYNLVRIGRSIDDKVEILSGLSEGEKFLAVKPEKGSDSK